MRKVTSIFYIWLFLSLSSNVLSASSNSNLNKGEYEKMDKPEILTKAPNIPPGVIPDEVNLSDTVNLEGLEVNYTYTSGRAYKLKFYDDRVSFSQLNEKDIPTLTVPYRSREIVDNIYLVHWLVPGRIGHVTLVLDLVNHKIQASALMPGQMELFDYGGIVELVIGKYTN